MANALTAGIMPGRKSIYINFPTRQDAIDFENKVNNNGGQSSAKTEGKQVIVNKLR